MHRLSHHSSPSKLPKCRVTVHVWISDASMGPDRCSTAPALHRHPKQSLALAEQSPSTPAIADPCADSHITAHPPKLPKCRVTVHVWISDASMGPDQCSTAPALHRHPKQSLALAEQSPSTPAIADPCADSHITAHPPKLPKYRVTVHVWISDASMGPD